ncbi:MAG TPA: KUP/HAK/KT family potassium transporter, partial [Polyangiales bacterium]|nr:KUP/HAK/KT family potassium transporter [Polyangiales bacterium]
GRSNLYEYYKERTVSWGDFIAQLEQEGVLRPKAVGVFMASDAHGVPAMVRHQAERIRAVPSVALLVTVRFERVPYVRAEDRIAEIADLGHGFQRVVARYGFMQHPAVPPVIEVAAKQLQLATTLRDVTYYLGRESLVAGPGGRMGPLLETFFRTLVRNSLPATAYFQLPPEQVMEIGLQIDL